MKQKVLGMMSGALMCLSLVFSSCGNIDNPLEELANTNSVAAQLKDALADGASITIKFNLNGDQSITFKKVEDGYKYDGDEADNMRYMLEYENGLLMFSIRGGEDGTPASQIFLNPKDNSFYIINSFGYNTTSNGKYSVNGVEGTLTNSCPDKATIEYEYTDQSNVRTRGYNPTIKKELVVYYNKAKGETWQDVINRYENSYLSWVLSSKETNLCITNVNENTAIVFYPVGESEVKDNQKVGVYDNPEDAYNYGKDVTDKYKASWISD